MSLSAPAAIGAAALAVLLAAPVSAARPLEARLAHGGLRCESSVETADALRAFAEELGGAEAGRAGDAARDEAAMIVVVVPAAKWSELAAWLKEKDAGAAVELAPARAGGGTAAALLGRRERLVRAAEELGAMSVEMPMTAAAVQGELDENLAELKRLSERRWVAFTARLGSPGQSARSMMADAAGLPPSADVVRAAIKALEDRSPADEAWSDYIVSAQARKDAARTPKGAAALLRRELAENGPFLAERPELLARARAALKRWDAPARRR